MLFVNPPGLVNFRALRVESGDQHLYWQPTYQHLLRVEGAFGEFFPQAEFSDNGNQVIFTKYVDSVEVLSRTRALKSGELIPRGEWKRFLETWANFKRLADRTDIPEDVRTFIFKFGPPSVERYPAAYRIYRPHWYSNSRLFILWGLEPVGGADFVSVTPEQAISEGTARAETDGQETSGNFLRWLKIFLLGLLALAALLFLVWCCLPRPVVDFEVSAEVDKPAVTKNLTTLDRSWDWGSRDYHWSFAQGIPDSSSDFEPKPLWLLPGPHDVTLEVTQSTLWGLLYKTEAKTINVTVTVPPKPPAVIVPPIFEIPGGPLILIPKGESPDGKAEKAPGAPAPEGKMPPDVAKPDGSRPDGKAEKLPGAPAPEGKMPPDAAKPEASKPESQMEKVPGVPAPDGKMPPDVAKPDGSKPDGKAEKLPGAPTPEGKMPADDKNPPGLPKYYGKPAPVPSVPGPDGKLPVPRSKILPVPQVVIEEVTPLSDGKSQDIDFSLRLPKGVKLEHLEVDGEAVAVPPNGSFRLRLPIGPHTLHIDYGSSSSNLHGQVTQELLVDADQVKVIKPKTRIQPPVKVPGSDQSEPVPAKPKDEAAEKFDKKTA